MLCPGSVTQKSLQALFVAKLNEVVPEPTSLQYLILLLAVVAMRVRNLKHVLVRKE